MAKYRNGDIPANLLVRRGNFLLTAGTWAKWDALVADVKRRFNVTLRITDGVGVMKGTGAYRDRPMQRAVKAYYTKLGRPWQAAAEGTSSHGGEFKGQDALAVDVTNYFEISYADFCAACRRAGFEPDYFDGKNGKPLERWHIIDRDPYRVVGKPAGGNATPLPKPAPVPEEEEDDMPKNTGLLYLAPMNATRKEQREYLLILNTGSGYQGAISSGPGGSIPEDRRREIANAFDTTSIIRVNEAEAKAFTAGLSAVRA